MAAPAGSTTRVAETVSVLASSNIVQNLDFELSVRYDSAIAGWLSLSPDRGTTPAQIAVTADPTNLPIGTHSAQVVAVIGPLRLSTVTSVFFTIAPAGANPGGVAASPSSLTFSAKSLALPQTVAISSAPGATGSVEFSAFASPSTWLAITRSDQVTPGTLEVRAWTSGLRPGSHYGTITVTATESGKSTVIPVTAVVPDAGIGQTVTLTPAQQSLRFNYQLNTTSNPEQTVSVSTDSTQFAAFTASTSDTWLGVAAAFWLPAGPTADCIAPGLFYVRTDPTGLAAGVYNGSITLSSPGLATVNLPVTLTVSATAVVNANPSFVSLNTAADFLTEDLTVTGSTPFFFTATVTGTPWLSVAPGTSVASDSPADLTITANPTGLPTGIYNGTVVLTGSGGSPTLSVPVQFKVSGATVVNALQVEPQTLDFTGIAGDDVLAQFVAIVSAMAVPQAVTIAATSEGGWLTVEPLSGTTPVHAKVTASSATAPGAHRGSLKVTSLVSGDEVEIPVTFALTARRISVAPASLTFRLPQQGAAVASQELQVTANARSSFQVAATAAWLRVQPAGTLATPAKLVVSVDAGALPPGSYETTIRLTGPNTVLVPVTVIIPEPPPPTVTPASISLAYELGSPAPAQTVTVVSPTAGVPFTATASTASGINWLSVAPSSGATPGALAVQVNVSRLTPGQHSGSVTVQVASTPAKTLTVPVSVTVSGSAVRIQEVLSSATFAPTLLSPGQLIALTGYGLGPSVPAQARQSSAGAFPTELAGVRVLFDGVAAPLLFANQEQINAIVPYALFGRTKAQIQVQFETSYSIPIEVKVVDASPGIFTASGAGRGQAAAWNADSTKNSAVNPASRGSIVVVYLTGEGQTDPPGQDGRVINTDLRKPLLAVTATVGGRAAEVTYAGSAPTMVSGMCQVNIRIPEGVEPGPQSIEIQAGGAPSQRGVTVEVR
jgi:uncharacterized protein (TIGR03437 family)